MKDIEILMKSGCTKKEALNQIKMGCSVVAEEDIDSYLYELNLGAADADEIITKEDIDSGKIENCDTVIFEGTKYYIFSVC